MTSETITTADAVQAIAANDISDSGAIVGTVNSIGAFVSSNQTPDDPVGDTTVRVVVWGGRASTAATLSGSNAFSGAATLTPGSSSTVAVVAADGHGNSLTRHYQVNVPAQPAYTPTYDADGNTLTSGAGQTYTWDAKNRLATITYTGGASSAFTYDVSDLRIGIVEKNAGGTVTSTKQLVWDQSSIVQERDVTNAVTKSYYAQGERIGSLSYYYTFDHLGSIRETTDSTGAIQARYDYEPYGRVTLLSGTNLSDFQYAGYYLHQISGLNLTQYRAYDAVEERWLSRDPLPNVEMSGAE